MLLAIVCAIRMTRMHADSALEKMANQNDPSATALISLLNHFSAVEDLLVLVTLPQEMKQADPETLLAYAAETRRCTPERSSNAATL